MKPVNAMIETLTAVFTSCCLVGFMYEHSDQAVALAVCRLIQQNYYAEPRVNDDRV